MLSVPKLDDLSYDKLFERARSQIPMYTGEWTDYNHHDPGITTLQTLAWLVDTLNYYIDATGEQHRLKYMSLLGLRPEQAAARCNIAISAESGELVLGRGAKLAAGGTVFELTEGYSGVTNSMTALFCEADGEFLNLTPFAGADGGFAAAFPCDRQRDSALYIGFARGFSETARFYADVCPHPLRNPFEDDFRLVELAWEYYDGERWRPADVRRDDTGGFLKSGFICLSLEGRTQSMDSHPVLPQAHYLRARLAGEYDEPPKIGRMYPGCVQAVQTDTCAQMLEYTYTGESELLIDYHVRENDVISVAVCADGGYSLWFEHVQDGASLCGIKTGVHPWQRIICFDREQFGACPEPGQKLLVMIADSERYDKLILGVTGGYACERVALDIENLHELRLALVEEKDGRTFYRIWDRCENLSEAACDAPVFQYDRERGEIMFGDGIRGEQPEAGLLVVAVTVKTSLLDGGNVRPEQINRFLDPAYSEIRAHNPGAAVGGKRPMSPEELEQEIEGKIYKTTRAVTVQDYIDIVRVAPGLIIDSVNVVSGKDYAGYYGGQRQSNTVLLAVKPYSEREKRPVLSEAYTRRLQEHIERRRLLTTFVRIVPARYVDIEVHGRIVLSENTARAREQVRAKLEELIDYTSTGRFGANVVYGRVFSHLEMLDCVNKVSRLSFSCIGEGGRKYEQGDITVYPDALACLAGVYIDFA